MSVKDDNRFNIVEASIEDLKAALSSGAVTCVELVARYLHRISTYDCRGISLNAIPVLNVNVFEEAAASDDHRAAGLPVRALEGVPYTVKDSYKVIGMTAASGSPAFQDLVANEDAFTVQKLREAGAVLIGRTNMPPMAAGGMQRGVYGRAESPYNLEYLAAAFASGSSNGSAVSTAASMAAFGMGEETVSSGRSPASNNGLVAYTPSRGLISIRGNWPLYPTCDVVVPQTRTMSDMCSLLDVITAEDKTTNGDFWRHQQFIKLPEAWTDRPSSFRNLIGETSLQGLRIAVPQMYIGGPQLPGSIPVTTSPEVIALWERARADLESLGATVILTSDFPLVTNYETPASVSPAQSPDTPMLPKDWNTVERGPLIAYAWDEFLKTNTDAKIPNLSAVESTRICPFVSPDDVQLRYSEPTNAIHWDKLVDYLKDPTCCVQNSVYDYPDLPIALRALEAARKRDLEDWMTSHQFDCVVFPANGDVGRADADITDESAKCAWKNGVKYSNGNRALRHLGVPTVSVPMGLMAGKGMPVNLTFAGKGWDDVKLLKWAAIFEGATRRRVSPKLTPELESDFIKVSAEGTREKREAELGFRPELQISCCKTSPAEESSDKIKLLRVDVQGVVYVSAECDSPNLEIFVDSRAVPQSDVVLTESEQGEKRRWTFTVSTLTPVPLERDERTKTEARVPRDMTMIVVVAKNMQRAGARASGWLGLR